MNAAVLIIGADAERIDPLADALERRDLFVDVAPADAVESAVVAAAPDLIVLYAEDVSSALVEGLTRAAPKTPVLVVGTGPAHEQRVTAFPPGTAIGVSSDGGPAAVSTRILTLAVRVEKTGGSLTPPPSTVEPKVAAKPVEPRQPQPEPEGAKTTARKAVPEKPRSTQPVQRRQVSEQAAKRSPVARRPAGHAGPRQPISLRSAGPGGARAAIRAAVSRATSPDGVAREPVKPVAKVRKRKASSPPPKRSTTPPPRQSSAPEPRRSTTPPPRHPRSPPPKSSTIPPPKFRSVPPPAVSPSTMPGPAVPPPLPPTASRPPGAGPAGLPLPPRTPSVPAQPAKPASTPPPSWRPGPAAAAAPAGLAPSPAQPAAGSSRVPSPLAAGAAFPTVAQRPAAPGASPAGWPASQGTPAAPMGGVPAPGQSSRPPPRLSPEDEARAELISSSELEFEQAVRRGRGGSRKLRVVILVLLLLALAAAVSVGVFGSERVLGMLRSITGLGTPSEQQSAAAPASASAAASDKSDESSKTKQRKFDLEKGPIPEATKPAPSCEKLLGPAAKRATKDGTTVQVYNMQAEQVAAQGDQKGALRSYCAGLRTYPDAQSLLVGQLSLLLLMGDAQAAEEQGSKAVEAFPKNAQLRDLLADALAHQGYWDEARQQWLKAAGVRSTDQVGKEQLARRHLNPARDALNQRKFRLARRFFRRAALLDPKNVEAATGMAQMLVRLEDAKPAVVWARRVLALQPHVATAHVLLGTALAKSGDLSGAEAAWRRALEYNPGQPEAKRRLDALRQARE